MPKQINNPFVSKKLVPLFGMKGRFQPILDEVVVPVVNVESEAESRPAMGYLTSAATAGEYSFALLTNPVGSNKLVTLERVCMNTGASGTVYATMEAIYVAGSIADANVAWRYFTPGLPSATMQVGNSASLVAAGNIHSAWTVSSTSSAPQWVDFEVILAPGEAFQIMQAVVNVQLSFSMHWRESEINVTA